MGLEVIYVTRHGFRSNWAVNHSTGEYTASLPSPTGIPADPELTSHGVDQAKQLAVRLRTVDPPIERVYSSPYYRCLQTIDPFASPRSTGADGEGEKKFTIRAEPGVGEWYGSAPFEHPTSAAPEVLKSMFPAVDLSYQPVVRPTRMGESLAELHARVAFTLQGIISQCDRDGVRAIVICTHAAVVIALGRVLTGAMPESVEVEDFQAFTCGLSVYTRKVAGSEPEDVDGLRRTRHSGDARAARTEPDPKQGPGPGPATTSPASPGLSRASHSEIVDGLLVQPWQGHGVGGGWQCAANSDCSHLAAGEERGWRFSGDEAFASSPQKGIDAGIGLGVVIEGKPKGTNSRL